MQARYYDPFAGRFLAVDPVTPTLRSFNRYWYADNSPFRKVDLDGRQSYDDLNLTGMIASEMLSNGQITEAEHLDMWSQGATSGAKGAALALTAAIPDPSDAIVLGIVGRYLAGRAPVAYVVAKEGGAHAGFLAQQIGKSVRELQSTIRSIEKQISLHEDKIRNPAKYMKQDDPSIPSNVERARIDWQKDIQRQSEQLDITKEVLKQKKSICTGTRIKGNC